ncbi:MAG: tRNA (N6-isopentenyl adenosine(37)-C2)-methylthiotransferase MiaB [Clostridiales bacterium]|jgi:tRNA-2-methylthio-N6-dimethylallyladenosine synthase|nr:tRNA (N6-isopentenyl adenosine(37)-C2)-methylthiotransferase MiaB [Clostridiales bacterium]
MDNNAELLNCAQNIYIGKCRKLNLSRMEFLKRPLKAHVRTFGCQMNAHDSEKMESVLKSMGYELSEDAARADLVLMNTCCVRENAENRVFGNLGKLNFLKKDNPDMIVVICGCMMQQDAVVEKIKKSYRHVDVIFGTYNLNRFPQLLLTRMETGKQVIDIWKEAESTEEEPCDISLRHFRFKASVNIMYGCDNFCSYCIVPYVRGRERSRPHGEILAEVAMLAQDGVKEVMLLGQNVNSYGGGIKGELTFAGLLDRICGVSGIERIRFMTSHPKDLSDELISTMKAQPKICKHLHLPVQSGSSRILKAMNRKYTKESYQSLVDNIKKQIPDISLTTDFIVGFPGETEEDFQDTCEIVKYARFSGAFTFLYSKRIGTPAASMEGQVPEEEANERLQRLLKLTNAVIYEENSKLVGRTLRVMPEEVSAKDPSLLTGRADNNALVHFRSSESLIGSFTDVLIEECKTFYLMGSKKD